MINPLDYQQGIKIDLQTVGVDLNQYLERKIRGMIKKLRHLFPQAGTIDIYLKHNSEQPSSPNNVTVRFGVPGPDLVASESGGRWKTVLKNVEKKLLRQLEKRKAAVFH